MTKQYWSNIAPILGAIGVTTMKKKKLPTTTSKCTPSGQNAKERENYRHLIFWSY